MTHGPRGAGHYSRERSRMSKPFTWSYSMLKDYETCPKRLWHLRIAKDIVEPPSAALEEGNALHKAFDEKLRKGTALPLPYARFDKMLEALRQAPGHLSAETKLGITRNLTPAAYFGKEVWLRGIIDATVVNGETAAVFDWKTGKPADDTTQLAINAGLIFAHMRSVQRVRSALVFVNYNEKTEETFTRETMAEQWNELIPRANAMEEAVRQTSFPAKSSGLCKRWCPVQVCPHCGI